MPHAYAVFEDWSEAQRAREIEHGEKQGVKRKADPRYKGEPFKYGLTGEFVFTGTAQECAEVMKREINSSA
jgi:hypothetical protein